MNEVTCTIEHSKSPETLIDQLINNKIDKSPELDTEFDDTISITKANSDDSFSMDTLHDSTIDTLDEPTLGGFYDLSDMDKFPNSKTDDVQMPEVSSTENVKSVLNNSLLMDTNIEIDALSSKIIIPNKPRIISDEVIEKKILLYHESNDNDENDNSISLNLEESATTESTAVEKLSSNNSPNIDIQESDSLLEMEDYLGFPPEDVEQSFKKLNRNNKKLAVKYNFPNIYRETSIISVPETESFSYLSFNLPDQVEPLESIVFGKNLIKPSMFYFKGSGYTELDSLMRKCSIIGKKRTTNKKEKSNKKKTFSIIRKEKLKMVIKNKMENLVNNSVELTVGRPQTRFSLKTLNQPSQLDNTPKSSNQSKPRKIISEINKLHLKELRIHLERIEIIKEYAHLDYMDSSPLIDLSDSSENEQSLRMDESSKKEISFATRRSDRLRKSEIKGIIALKSKYHNKQKRRVSFSDSVFKYEY